MKNSYPIIMTEGKEYILVYIPDFNINTQGKTYAEAMEMARDAIGIMGIDMEDDNQKIPAPTRLEIIKENCNNNDVISLVDIDFAEYRKKNSLRDVKKNSTIPV